MTPSTFKNRKEAGQQLLPRLEDLESAINTVILGISRGGVIVAREVAEGFDLPLEVIAAKKLGVPGNPPLTMGAIAEGSRMLNKNVIKKYDISEEALETETTNTQLEIERRAERFRHGKPLLNLIGKTVIIIDDGSVTGATMLATIHYARTVGAHEIVAAIPVASEEALQKIEKEADSVVCLQKVGPYFMSVGEQYEHFPPISDAEVVAALKSLRSRAARINQYVKKEKK